jgi:hypothetical protein
MKLWILRPIKGLPKESNPWEPWYDKTFGFVVRAETENDARILANQKGACEVDEDEHCNPWMDKNLSTCVELSSDGEEELIINDHRAA